MTCKALMGVFNRTMRRC